MASKFRESPRSRRRGLQTPPHVHWGESGQSGLERESGAVCVVLGVSGDGIGRPATRAKQAAEKPDSLKGTAFRPSDDLAEGEVLEFLHISELRTGWRKTFCRIWVNEPPKLCQPRTFSPGKRVFNPHER